MAFFSIELCRFLIFCPSNEYLNQTIMWNPLKLLSSADYHEIDSLSMANQISNQLSKTAAAHKELQLLKAVMVLLISSTCCCLGCACCCSECDSFFIMQSSLTLIVKQSRLLKNRTSDSEEKHDFENPPNPPHPQSEVKQQTRARQLFNLERVNPQEPAPVPPGIPDSSNNKKSTFRQQSLGWNDD